MSLTWKYCDLSLITDRESGMLCTWLGRGTGQLNIAFWLLPFGTTKWLDKETRKVPNNKIICYGISVITKQFYFCKQIIVYGTF